MRYTGNNFNTSYVDGGGQCNLFMFQTTQERHALYSDQFNASYVDGGGQSNHPNTHQVLTVNQEDTTDYNLFDFII